MDSSQRFYGAASALSILVLIIAAWYVFLPNFILNFERLSAAHPYVIFTPWDLPFFVGTPLLLSLVLGVAVRLFNKASDKFVRHIVKFALVFVVLTIITRVGYGFVGVHYLETKEYSRCWHLSSPSTFAGSVWVRHPEYCIDSSGPLRKPLLRWMDGQAQSGKPINATALRKQLLRLEQELVSAE